MVRVPFPPEGTIYVKWNERFSHCLRPGGSLSDVIATRKMREEIFSEGELKDLLLQVSMGLKYIHSAGLVHLDIKPSKCQIAVPHGFLVI